MTIETVCPDVVPGTTGGRGVLEGAFALLEGVRTAEQARLTALAAECGLPKATAHRLLEQLTELGALERSSGTYRIGPRMLRLGQSWRPDPQLLSVTREPVRRLAQITGAIVGVGVLSHGRPLMVDVAPGELSEIVRLRPGITGPWNTAVGKALVATMDSAVPLGPVPRGWPKEAAAIRDDGLAVDDEELMDGVCCVAVPLYGHAGKPTAALCAIVTPRRRTPRLTDTVARFGGGISAGLRILGRG